VNPSGPEDGGENMTLVEKFRKEYAKTIGWLDLPQGGFREVIPRLRVELYDMPSKVYGPIMLSFNAVRPENMKASKTLAQAHLTEIDAIRLCALIVRAIKEARPGTTTINDILRQIGKEAIKL